MTASPSANVYPVVRLLASLLLMTIAASSMYGAVLVLQPAAAEFGTGRGAGSTPYTLFMVGFGLGGIMMGRLSDRFGILSPALIASLCLPAGLLLAARATELWQFGVSLGVLCGLLGIAGTFAAGVREVFGSHAKAMHPAKAASNGVQSARLATQGFSGADDILGGRRGFWQVLSPNGHSEEALLAGIGSRWELGNNGLKPYANGVVSHPIQDAVITLRNEHGIAPEDVASIDAEVNPLVLELMNRAEPRRGLEGKFSFQHCAAAALVDGAGHDAQFSDARVADPVISAVRSKVSAAIVESMREDEVRLSITLTSGQVHSIYVEHATGSPENPMTDSALEAKYRSLAGEALPASQVEELLGAVWDLESAPNVEQVARLMAL